VFTVELTFYFLLPITLTISFAKSVIRNRNRPLEIKQGSQCLSGLEGVCPGTGHHSAAPQKRLAAAAQSSKVGKRLELPWQPP
jgi:hypothetical protein